MRAPIIRATELAAERPAGWINDEHFPTSLVAFVIKTYSEPGDRVLDPFAGSGTTLAVATRLGRKAVGVELLADRVAMARARVDDPSCVIQGNALHLDQFALGAFDLCLTSPPYMNAVDHPQNPLTGYQTMDADYQHYISQMGDVFAAIGRHLAPTGALVLSVANIQTENTVTPLADDLVATAMRAFTVRETIPLTWDQPPTWLVADRLVVLDPIGQGQRAHHPRD